VNLSAFDNRPVCHSMHEFTDGLSNTLLVGEKAFQAGKQGDRQPSAVPPAPLRRRPLVAALVLAAAAARSLSGLSLAVSAV
jgi:hypothetical protein